MNVVPHPATEPRAPKLLDRMRSAIRVRHYSIRTEEAKKKVPGTPFRLC